MAMSTQNSGALVEGVPAGGPKVKVKLLVDTFIKDQGDCEAGEVVEVSVSDYHYLTGYKYAEPVKAGK